MSPTASELLREALALEEADRASLAGALIESLESEPDQDAAGSWEATIRRRIEELGSGKVQLVGWSEVRERLFRGFE